ncbi:MAG: glycosyltransferase family 4 protein [Candidatus Competibacteraceae bacterium]|nr:glycosyltransferase family 4 protein [Candidatus Competibacteraceae bacterium]
MQTAPRVLLSVYQCGPGMGSVSQIGWQWYSQLAQRLPTTLVTHSRNRPALTAAGTPLPGSEVLYIDTEWFAGPLYRLASRLFPSSQHAVFLISSLDYYVYDWAAVRQLRQRQAQGERWDIVHVPTPVSPLAATRLHRLGPPVILGPWNGGLGSPPAFRDIQRREAGWLNPIRNLGRWLDGLTGSTRNAALILTATQATLHSIPERYRARCEFMLENGVDLAVFKATPWPATPSVNNPLHVVYVGRLIPFKGVTYLLQAAARIKDRYPLRITVIGEGPLAEELQDETRERGLHAMVTFTGSLTAPQVAEQLQAAHVFCLPSVRESGGAVLLEAMASGRPVIAVDFGGPAEIVDDTVGVLIPPRNEETLVAGLVNAFSDVEEHPEQWRQRGEQGRQKAEQHFGWGAKVDRAVTLYQRVLESR